MHEAEGVNFKVGFIRPPIPGKESRRIPSSNESMNNPSIQDVLNFINNLNISADDKKTLSKMAKSMPFGSLKNIILNYRNYLRKA
jgi:hypothetical protein